MTSIFFGGVETSIPNIEASRRHHRVQKETFQYIYLCIYT